MYRRTLVIFAVLAAVVGTSLTVSSPAMAYGTRPDSCNTASLCFYNKIRFVDGPGKVTGRNNNLAVFPHTSCPNGTWSNCMSSVWNATLKCFHLYDATGATGAHHNLAPNDGYTDMGAQTSLSNKVSSVKPNPNGTGNCNFS